MAEAYCVKDKKKVEDPESGGHHHEEWQAGDTGHLPSLWRQGLPDRRRASSPTFGRNAEPPPSRRGFARPVPPACRNPDRILRDLVRRRTIASP